MYYYIGNYNLKPSNKCSLTIEEVNDCIKSLNFGNGNGEAIVCHDKRIVSRQEVISVSDELDDIKVIFEGNLCNKEIVIRDFVVNDSKIYANTNANCIAKLYKNTALKNIQKLEGDFSFIIIDERLQHCFLYRSPSGLKPLFYCEGDSFVLFGSYLKLLTNQPKIKREINPTRIYSFFMTDGLSLGDDTEFLDIVSLKPGELLMISDGEVQRKAFNCEANSDTLIGKSEEFVINEYYQEIERIFNTIYKTHKDVGIAFSGGLDTLAIIAFAKKFGISATTFTIKFQNTSNKNKIIDYEQANVHSQKYGAKHHEIEFTPRQFIVELDDVLNNIERVVSLSELNTYMIMKLVSKQSDIVMSGDGSEEQLGMMNLQKYGYNADRLLQTLPEHNAKSLSETILVNYYNMLFWRGWGWHCEHRTEESIRQVLFSNDYVKIMEENVDLFNVFNKCYLECGDTSFFLKKSSSVPSIFNKILRMDYRNFILHNKIAITDIASRLYSFQAVFPYLQSGFANYSSNIPGELKYKAGSINGTKLIFRKALSGLLGEEDAFPGWKSGSDFPLNEWMNEDVARDYAYDVLDSNRVGKSGIINCDYVKRILSEHYELRKFDHTHKIGKLIVFQKWWENNIA